MSAYEQRVEFTRLGHNQCAPFARALKCVRNALLRRRRRRRCKCACALASACSTSGARAPFCVATKRCARASKWCTHQLVRGGRFAGERLADWCARRVHRPKRCTRAAASFRRRRARRVEWPRRSAALRANPYLRLACAGAALFTVKLVGQWRGSRATGVCARKLHLRRRRLRRTRARGHLCEAKQNAADGFLRAQVSREQQVVRSLALRRPTSEQDSSASVLLRNTLGQEGGGWSRRGPGKQRVAENGRRLSGALLRRRCVDESRKWKLAAAAAACAADGHDDDDVASRWKSQPVASSERILESKDACRGE